MSRGPVPSHLELLSRLPSRAIGDKVRFLGCVTSYSTESGCLSLGHLYPRGTNVSVLVDVNLLLDSLSSETTRVGEHVNVIGYITSRQQQEEQEQQQKQQKQLHHHHHHQPSGKDALGTSAQVSVQAVLLWSTGPMDMHEYERSFGA